MAPVVRKTSTKVVKGDVRTKSRFIQTAVHGYRIRKLPAARGYTHVVSPRQLEEFISIIPGWADLSHRLGYIELAPGSPSYFGLRTSTLRGKVDIIVLHAWSKKLWTPWSPWFFRCHRHIIEALQVPYVLKLPLEVICKFSVAQARAFSLLHVFMHELGHHHDWLHRRGPRKNVEGYANDFADSYFEILFPTYIEKFGDPRWTSVKEGEVVAIPAGSESLHAG